MTQPVDVVINGERKHIRGGALLDVLAELQLDPRTVVVEHNRKIVRRPVLHEVSVSSG
ncbi:MAG: hypothetical protein JF602_01815, partial [Gemmatimonadetes bacterium]|nr:hypothetical protein [Gemmatimonadota bacterium]